MQCQYHVLLFGEGLCDPTEQQAKKRQPIPGTGPFHRYPVVCRRSIIPPFPFNLLRLEHCLLIFQALKHAIGLET